MKFVSPYSFRVSAICLILLVLGLAVENDLKAQCNLPTSGFSHTSSFRTVTYTDTSKTDNTINTWYWDFGDGNTSNIQHPQHTYAGPGTYTVFLWVWDTCGYDVISKFITIVCPGPAANFGSTINIRELTFQDSSTGPNSIFQWLWDFGDGNTDSIQNPVHNYLSDGTYNVCLTVTDSCSSNMICMSVTAICTIPTASFSFTQQLFTFNFTDESTTFTSFDSWQWDFGDGNTSTLQNPTHVYGGSDTFAVCLTVTDTCGSDVICQQVITGCAQPVSGFSWQQNFLDVNFTDVSTSALLIQSWSWNFGDGNTSTLQNPSHTYAAQDTYLVCLLITDTCGTDSFCQMVPIPCAVPTAGFTHNSSFLTTTFIDASVTGNSFISYAWDFGDGNTNTLASPVHTYASPGVYTACLIVVDSCGTDTICDSFYVNCPVASWDYNIWNLQVSFFDSTQTQDSIISWAWDFGDGNIDSVQNPIHFYTIGDTFDICLIVTDSCGTDTSCNQIFVDCGDPISDFFYSNYFRSYYFTNTSQTVNTLLTYSWDFGDSTYDSIPNPAHTFDSVGTYIVCLTVTDSCGLNSYCDTIIVSCPEPQVSFTHNDSLLTVEFTNTSNVSYDSSASYWWDFGDGLFDSIPSPTHIFIDVDTYSVCLTVIDSCGSGIFCDTLIVTCPSLVADFVWTDSLLIYQFYDTSTTPFASADYFWDFGDSMYDSIPDPLHAWAVMDTYVVCLTVTDSCGAATTCKTIIPDCPGPDAEFEYADTNFTVHFYDSSETSYATVSYWWDFGDSTVDSVQYPVHTYANAGIYSVCLIVTDSCGSDTACNDSVKINCPWGDFGYTFQNLTATFTDQSQVDSTIFSWDWDFGDGYSTTTRHPVHTFPSAGSYQVCLIVEDTCGIDTICKIVEVICPVPLVEFSDTSVLLSGTFSSDSTVTFSGPIGWEWDFGDSLTDTLQNPIHIFPSSGIYTVCLKVTDSCGIDSTCHNVTIECFKPTVNFGFDDTLRTVTFSDSSSHSYATATYFWDFGDSTYDSIPNPTHVFDAAGIFNVCLTLVDSCGSTTACQNILVSCPDPVVDFGYSTSLLTAMFADSSSTSYGTRSYLWDFGDSTYDSIANPMHTYAGPGSYTVCLAVFDSCGSDTFCQVVILSCPEANWSFNGYLLTGTFTDITNSNNTPHTWFWDFGDGGTDTVQNPTHDFPSSGTYYVCMTVTDTCGVDTYCDSISVICVPPVIAFADSHYFLSVYFADTSTVITTRDSILWDFGDGSTDTLQNPAHTFDSAGTYTVCLTLSDTCGQSTGCRAIVIGCPEPVPNFNFTTNLLVATITDLSAVSYVGSAVYDWDFGDGGIDSVKNPIHAFPGPGTYTVCLTITDSCGIDSICKTISVRCPEANFTILKNLLTADFADISITNNAVHTWAWDFGDGNTDTIGNPTHTYASAGFYTVCMIVTDTCGTDSICKLINISCPLPTVSFGFSVSKFTATFNSNVSASYPTFTYHWDFGDSTFDSTANPVHVYTSAADYIVCLTISDSCGTKKSCRNLEIRCPQPFIHSIILDNQTGNTQNNYPILMRLNTAALIANGDMRSDCGDMRFSDDFNNNIPLPYWIESGINTTNTEIWVLVPNIPTGITDTIWMHSGDAVLTSTTDFNSTFPNKHISSSSQTWGGVHSFDWFEWRPPHTLTVQAGSKLTINARRLIITGDVDGDGSGFNAGGYLLVGDGPGGGDTSVYAGAGGAGYGGDGGDGGYDFGDGIGFGGSSYGSVGGLSIKRGSGGASTDLGLGGNGGGAITFSAEIIEISGNISSNGIDGTGLVNKGGGGGSGGGIMVVGDVVRYSGNMSVDGGQGGDGVSPSNDGGGGAGGGRIKLFSDSVLVNTGTHSENPGRGGIYGSWRPGQSGKPGTFNADSLGFGRVESWIDSLYFHPFYNELSLSINSPACPGDTNEVVVQGDFISYEFYQNGNLMISTTDSIWATPNLSQGDTILVVAFDSICIQSAEITVNLLPQPVANILYSDSTPCTGDTISLSVDSMWIQAIWDVGDTAYSILVDTVSTHCVQVQDSQGCWATTCATVSYFDANIQIMGDTNFCDGDSAVLDAGPGMLFLWSTTEVTQVIDVSQPGTYIVTVTDLNGCIGTDSITLNQLPLPTPTITQNGDTLTASVASSYQWSQMGGPIPGATGQVYIPAVNGLYSVTVTDGDGCYGVSDTVSFLLYSVQVSWIEGVKVYPNPHAGMFTIEANVNTNADIQMEIVDLTGRVVMRYSFDRGAYLLKEEIRMESVTDGIYFLKLGIAGEKISYKIIKMTSVGR